MLCKAVSSSIFWVFGMTKSWIEPRSPGPLANTVLIKPTESSTFGSTFVCLIIVRLYWIYVFQYIYIYIYSLKFKTNGVASLFNGVSTFVGYLMPKTSLYKKCRGTISPIAVELRVKNEILGIIIYIYIYICVCVCVFVCYIISVMVVTKSLHGFVSNQVQYNM